MVLLRDDLNPAYLLHYKSYSHVIHRLSNKLSSIYAFSPALDTPSFSKTYIYALILYNFSCGGFVHLILSDF